MDTAEQLKLAGNELFKSGQYLGAIEKYSAALELNPNESSYYGNRSACHFNLANYRESLEDCLAAIQLYPAFAKAMLRAAKCYLQFGDISQASSYLARAKDLEPSNKQVIEECKTLDRAKENVALLRQFQSTEKHRQAIVIVEELIATMTLNNEMKLKKLEILIEAGEVPSALSYSTAVLSGFSGNPEFLVLRGRAHYYNNSPELARKHFMEALRLDPDNSSARKMVKLLKELDKGKEEANKLYADNQLPEALEVYTAVLALDPANKKYNAMLLSNRAAAYMKSSNYLKALEDLNKCLEYNPDYIKAYMRRANVQVQLENYDQALFDYNNVKQRDPRYPELENCIRLAKNKAKNAKRKDYYAILGIEKTANDSEIKKAYRKQALKWHPDKNSETTESKEQADKMFKDIGEAYAVLSDSNKRRMYESGMDLDEMEGGMGSHGGFGGMDPTVIFETVFGGQGGMFGGLGGHGFSRNGGHSSFTFKYGR